MHNPEKRLFRGRSYKKGGERINRTSLSRNEINGAIEEQEDLEAELRYGTSEPKLLAERKRQEQEQNADIMRLIVECREEEP